MKIKANFPKNENDFSDFQDICDCMAELTKEDIDRSILEEIKQNNEQSNGNAEETDDPSCSSI